MLKTGFRAALWAAAALALAPACAWAALDRSPLPITPERALLVGNSYSFYNCGVHTALRGLMQASTPAIAMKTRLLTISSGSLSFHDMAQYLRPHELDPYADLKEGRLTRPMFDVVLLQENSAGAISKKRWPVMRRMVAEHARVIRTAGSIPMLVMTWPRKTKPEDGALIARHTVEAAAAADMRVVPVGLAFEAARKARPDLELYMPDNSHPSQAGTYLYASVLYASLFNRSPEALAYAGECEKPLPADVAAFLRRIAWETVNAFNRR